MKYEADVELKCTWELRGGTNGPLVTLLLGSPWSTFSEDLVIIVNYV